MQNKVCEFLKRLPSRVYIHAFEKLTSTEISNVLMLLDRLIKFINKLIALNFYSPIQ